MDSPKEPKNQEQTTSTDSPKSASASRSNPERLSAWVAANGLYVETALAVIAIGVGTLSIPLVVFGLFTALEGETSILSVGTVIAALGFVTLGGLSVVLLVHARVEFRRYGLSFNDGHDVISTTYTVVRTVETMLAGTFLISVFSAIVAALAVSSVPDLLPAIVGFSAILLPVLVIAHGCGATVRYMFDLG
ncbi:hypothetical protein EKH57_16775 [Halorubrum sp. BOL3-1]|uniref:hypothetical protein n=1 Tax=Halorubrum sp. BOL3-1 TaxID=2497325 RepID=UPI001004DBC2|nr:hypothetical protein [Halorubrum sp. BOL3-1]QAU14187.1 hypothetical protein EKH57_16775 [Halorubrum sp. BOL3-1]